MIDKKKRKIIAIVAIAIVLIGALAFAISRFVIGDINTVKFRKLNIPINSNFRAFGNRILYMYDGMLYCATDNGTTVWSYDVGDGAQMYCDNKTVVVWRKSNIYVLDSNGHSSYSDNLGQDIIFARVNKQYFGVVTGEERRSRLSIYDLKGTQIDEESVAFKDSIILDFDFFGDNGEYMWTLKLETDSTSPDNILNTFEVGKMNTGEISLGDYITYAVIADNKNLDVINTRRMLYYDYRISKQTKPSLLVYGWTLIDKLVYNGKDAYMLFSPVDQSDVSNGINELRMVHGNKDMRYTLPATASATFLSNKYLYAISSNTIYKASIDDTSFVSYPVNMVNAISKHIVTLASGKVLVSDGQDIYIIELP